MRVFVFLLLIPACCAAGDYSYTVAAPNKSPGAGKCSVHGSALVINLQSSSGATLPALVDGGSIVYYGASTGSFTIASHTESGGTVTVMTAEPTPDFGAVNSAYTFAGSSSGFQVETTLADVATRLDVLNASVSTLVFLLTACAFTLGGILGFHTWKLVLIAMRESDF